MGNNFQAAQTKKKSQKVGENQVPKPGELKLEYE